MAASIVPVNPYTHEKLGEYPLLSATELSDRTARAGKAFVSWRGLPIGKRAALLSEALSYFETHREQVATDITAHMGKPITQARREIDTFFERANHLIAVAEETLKPEILPSPAGQYRAIEHEPLGVVLVISAWNYPLVISVNGVISALLTGNTVLLKHSSITPIIGDHFARAFGNLGGLENILQSFVADHTVTAGIIENPGVDHVIFTGSVRGGHEIYRSAARRFIDCNLELGGKDGAYVAEDADVKSAAESLVDGAMYNAGQSCCGIERVYVHEKVYPEFLKHAEALCRAYVLGDPMEATTNLGPLADPASAHEMERQVGEALRRGALLLCGGETTLMGKAVFFPPTLLADVPQEAEIMKLENFGPLLPVSSVPGDEPALRRVNDSAYGLTCAIYTRDEKRAQAFARGAETGTVFMNRCDYLDPALPWTGVKDSGKGSALSRYGMLALTRRKALNFRLA